MANTNELDLRNLPLENTGDCPLSCSSTYVTNENNAVNSNDFSSKERHQ
jgi:hypothetical protein